MGTDEAEYARRVRQVAEGSDWAVREGTLSQNRGGKAFHVYHFADHAFLMAKPLIWDQIFWNVMGITFKRRPGASRHWWGGNCPVPKRDTTALKRGSATVRAARAFAFAEKGLRRLAGADLSRLPDLWHPTDRPGDFLIPQVIIRLAEGDAAGARRLAEDVVEGRTKASFNIRGQDGQSFFERVAKRAPEYAL